MPRYGKPDVTVVSAKGQVVIPQTIREELGLLPKTRLLVYKENDLVILKKMEIPEVTKNLEATFKRVDARVAKYGGLTEEEIVELVHKYRQAKA